MSKPKVASAKGKKLPDKTKEKSATDELNQKLTQATSEIEALKRELGWCAQSPSFLFPLSEFSHQRALAKDFRSETINRLKQQNTEYRDQITTLEATVEAKMQDRVDVTSDMSRQYKVMQFDMSSKMSSLDAQLAATRTQLTNVTETLHRNEAEYKRSLEEKDALIEEQYTRINCMAAEFESMLSETLDKMAKKLEAASQRWRDDISLTEANQRRLSEFLGGKGEI
ncbi:hypothetical protein RI367_003252 [Sorochytrium milnesiophthora]